MPQDLTDDKSTLVQAMAWCLDPCHHMASLGHNELNTFTIYEIWIETTFLKFSLNLKFWHVHFRTVTSNSSAPAVILNNFCNTLLYVI